MRVLAMETGFDPSGIALADDRGIVASLTFRHERDFSKWWAPRLSWLLEQSGWTASDLEGVAVGTGPGSFTGLRIGVAAAKTMAQALRRPIVGMSSLELLAAPYRGAWVGAVASLLPCRRGEAYRAIYGGDAGRPPAVATLEELRRELSEIDEPLLVCGDAGPSDEPVIPDTARRGDPWLARPHVDMLALEGRRRLLAGDGVDPIALRIEYLKRSQAEESAERFARSMTGR